MSMLKDKSEKNTPAPPAGPTEVAGDTAMDKHE